jgi:hypothetical protein
MIQDDKTIESLLDLDGETFFMQSGYWVKFEVRKVKPTKDCPHGVRYSLTLHDPFKRRIMGFDNAHAIEYGGKRGVAPKRTHDHWHSDSTDKGKPYHYVTAGKLLEDFWMEVDKLLRKLEGTKK